MFMPGEGEGKRCAARSWAKDGLAQTFEGAQLRDIIDRLIQQCFGGALDLDSPIY